MQLDNTQTHVHSSKVTKIESKNRLRKPQLVGMGLAIKNIFIS